MNLLFSHDACNTCVLGLPNNFTARVSLSHYLFVAYYLPLLRYHLTATSVRVGVVGGVRISSKDSNVQPAYLIG
jgi:hypothetical protein